MKKWNDIICPFTGRTESLASFAQRREHLHRMAKLAKHITLSDRLRHAQRKCYYIGGGFPNVYFTRREAECMVLLLQGYTMSACAKELKLSTRTIEFYVKNMRNKVSVSSKSELVQCVMKTNFIEYLERDLTVEIASDHQLEFGD